MRGALAAAVAAVVLLAGAGPAGAGGLPEVTVTGTPGPGRTVTLSGELCNLAVFGGPDTEPHFEGAEVQIGLFERITESSLKGVITRFTTSDVDGTWSFDFAIPHEGFDGSPVVPGKTYVWSVGCNREGSPDLGMGPFNYEDVDFTMGAAGTSPPPDPDPAPDPDPEPAPGPTTPPTVQGNTVTQPPPPAAAPAAPVATPRALAFTGDDTETLAAAGGALLALGTAVLLLARRTRRVEIT